jgi:hypothetical protein
VKYAFVAIALYAATADAEPRKKVATRERATESVEKPLVFIPFEAPKRPSMTLAAGTVQLQTTLEMADQMSIAPDISIGMSDELTLSFITSSSALSGFRGSAGSGICISDGCDRRLVDGGVEALFSVHRGQLPTAIDVGVLASSFGPQHTDLKLGFKTKLVGAHAFLVASPNLWLALDDRHEDQLMVPVSAWLKLGHALAVGVGSGVKGQLAHLDKTWAVPAGGSIQVSPLKTLQLGASLVFGKALAGEAVMDPGFTAYAIQVWTTISSQ